MTKQAGVGQVVRCWTGVELPHQEALLHHGGVGLPRQGGVGPQHQGAGPTHQGWSHQPREGGASTPGGGTSTLWRGGTSIPGRGGAPRQGAGPPQQGAALPQELHPRAAEAVYRLAGKLSGGRRQRQRGRQRDTKRVPGAKFEIRARKADLCK